MISEHLHLCMVIWQAGLLRGHRKKAPTEPVTEVPAPFLSDVAYSDWDGQHGLRKIFHCDFPVLLLLQDSGIVFLHLRSDGRQRIVPVLDELVCRVLLICAGRSTSVEQPMS